MVSEKVTPELCQRELGSPSSRGSLYAHDCGDNSHFESFDTESATAAVATQ